MNSPSIQCLNDLSRLREAPTLDQGTKDQLREELRLALTQFSWFTIGVMAYWQPIYQEIGEAPSKTPET